MTKSKEKWKVIDWKKKRDKFLSIMLKSSKAGDKKHAQQMLTMAAYCNQMRYRTKDICNINL